MKLLLRLAEVGAISIITTPEKRGRIKNTGIALGAIVAVSAIVYVVGAAVGLGAGLLFLGKKIFQQSTQSPEA